MSPHLLGLLIMTGTLIFLIGVLSGILIADLIWRDK